MNFGRHKIMNPEAVLTSSHILFPLSASKRLQLMSYLIVYLWYKSIFIFMCLVCFVLDHFPYLSSCIAMVLSCNRILVLSGALLFIPLS